MRDDRDRTLHLLDIQSLHDANDGELDRTQVEVLLGRYQATVPFGPDDHLRVACLPAQALEVGLACAPGQLIVRGGRGGPERALLESIDPRAVAGRFHRLVIGSGNGAFACAIQRLIGAGVDVHVVSLCDRTDTVLRVAGAPIAVLSRRPVVAPSRCLAAAS